MTFMEKFEHCSNFVDVFAESFVDDFVGQPQFNLPVCTEELKELAMIHCDRVNYILGLVQNDKLLGYVEVYTATILKGLSFETVEAVCIYVPKEYRRQGYAESLIKELIQRERADVYIVNPDNVASINLAKKLNLPCEIVVDNANEKVHVFDLRKDFKLI